MAEDAKALLKLAAKANRAALDRRVALSRGAIREARYMTAVTWVHCLSIGAPFHGNPCWTSVCPQQHIP